MTPGFGMTPVQRHLMKLGAGRFGVSPGPPPPRDGERVTLVVRDTDGLDCEAAKYPLLALNDKGDASWA